MTVISARNPGLSLTTLTEQWKAAKQFEKNAADRRIAIESAIYELVQNQLPEKGTTTLETGMKVVTGFSESWDQEKIQAAYQQWPLDAGVPFPFRGEWKPDGKAIGYLRDNCPDLYRLIQDGLTLTPKKPAFSVKEV